MDLTAIATFISGVGFPIAACVGMGIFIYLMVKKNTEANQANMEKLQARCIERENKLYEEIKENREVNASAIATIGLYADRLNHIEDDVGTMKTDITIIKEKVCN